MREFWKDYNRKIGLPLLSASNGINYMETL